ncbi:rod shape-determining protein [Streptacidiphilus pinicola]|nr:rod shape-determining protein [Streptacidiphilus pinicola]
MTSVAAVDLGTSRIRVWHPTRGPVLDEPSLVALDEDRGHACAIGTTAKNMIGRVPDGVSVRRAVEGGRVTDFEAARMLAQHAMDRLGLSRRARHPTVVTAVPVDCSRMQIRALEQALLQVGAAQVVVVPTPVAAVAGGALPAGDGAGGLLVDIGAGTADLAVFARGRMVDALSAPIGGDVLDQAVAAWIRREHQVAVGPRAAEQLRIDAGTGLAAATASPLQARGQHVGSGANRTVYVPAEDLRQACRPVLTQLTDAIRRLLSRCPGELRSAIALHGVMLTGGLAHSTWVREQLQAGVDVLVRVADAPDTRTAEGLAVLSRAPDRALDVAIRA